MFPQIERNIQFTFSPVDFRGLGNSIQFFEALRNIQKQCYRAKSELGVGRRGCRIHQKNDSDPTIFPYVKWAFCQPSIPIYCCL